MQQSAAAQTLQQNTIERTIHFNQAQAIVWQIKFIINQISSKKALSQAANEIESLSGKFGKDFDKYLMRELIEQIDLKDPVKAQKDKNEPLKVQLLNSEFARCVMRPEFLSYFGEIATNCGFGERLTDFMAELIRRLKLTFSNQILVALSLVESSREESQPEAIKILKQKLQEYYAMGRPEAGFPDYALHQLMFLYSTHPEMNSDENRENIMQYLVDSNPLKSTSHVSLRGAMQQDLMFANVHPDDPSISLFKEGNGIDNLDKSYKMLEPWQLLIELGHMSSYNYNQLLKILEDFKDINEKTMARTLLYLAINHTGPDDQASKIAQYTFEANRKADSSILKKEVVDKKNSVTWSVDNLVRAFRELFSHLNWAKVLEALSEITDELYLDAKAFSTFLQIINKSKPQNLPYPLTMILQSQWANPLLQLSFIENSIQFYIEKKEKSIYFLKAGERRQEMIDEITGIKDKVSIEFLHVWLSVDLVERLLILSDSHHFHKVRSLFEAPLKQVPEYLLLTLSLSKANKGSLMIDELLSLLLPQFLGNHINSILVLQSLWKNNQALMIRAVCELCRHDQRIMNLSRVLDITQEVKESLMPIVDCEDYYFAVNLAILAGKRDFLHYDVWLQRRISDVGTPFIKALLKYIKEHIVTPIIEYQKRTPNTPDPTADQLELFKQQVLERSHLSKEKLCITIENLSTQVNQNNPLIKPETKDQIRELMAKLSEQFPPLFAPAQNSEEIDNAANDYFQRVFSAEPHLVDQKITELIDIMQRFRNSEHKKEQEIYACMLHSLFDEYRFLHKYPLQYLEKIAKLYGAIIKNKIIDGTLQDIALKFVVEAFRREGKRMKFGIIVVRQIMELLPQFPQFFDGIYDLRHNLAPSEPQLVKEIEDLYDKSMPKGTRIRAPSGPLEDTNKALETLSSKYKSTFSSFSSDSVDDRIEESKLTKASRADLTGMPPQMQKINETEFLATFQQNAAQAPAQSQVSQPVPSKKEGKGQKAQQQEAKQSSQPVFNPTYKVRGQPQPDQSQSHPQTSFTTTNPPSFQPTFSADAQSSQLSGLNTALTAGLNPSSVAFSRRPGAPPNGQSQPPTIATPTTSLQMSASAPTQFQLPPAQGALPSSSIPLSNLMNMNVRPFRPTQMRSPAPQTSQPIQQQSQFNQQFYLLQQSLDVKIQKAISENARVKLEDIIEDSNMAGSNISEEVRNFLNTTARNNFLQKMEELKLLINQNPQVYFNYFVHQILLKKMNVAPAILQIYIDAIKVIGIKDSISLTISVIMDLFRKCMLINEDMLNQVLSQRPQQGVSFIKQYLIQLGQFLGLLTVANNRPIYAKELDIKQLLVEGFTSEKMKYVVTFACRILKECQKSTIFKNQNPWVKANLDILKEIYLIISQTNQNNQYIDLIHELESLFKTLNISPQQQDSTGFLKAAVSSDFKSQSQQIEVIHMMNKSKIIPAVQPPTQLQQNFEYQRPASVSPGPGGMSQFPGGMPGQGPNAMMIMPLGQQQQQREYEMLQGQQTSNSIQIASKVDLTQEFLVMLGLRQESLTQQQERDLRQILADAVSQSIVEILPPVVDRSVTISLITTRELVLKDFAFDFNWTRILKAADLIVQNLAGSLALVTCREPLKMQLTNNLKLKMQEQQQTLEKLIQCAAGDPHSKLSDAMYLELASQASKDNLELGCKMIKQAVIERALTKVREDILLARAIEVRKMAGTAAEFRANCIDQSLVAQFVDLPQQLKPNEDGLSEAQFQVYEDFANLSKQSMSTGGTAAVSSSMQPIQPADQAALDVNDDVEAYLRQYESLSTFERGFETQLGQKLAVLAQRPDQHTVQINKLRQFSQTLFFSVCERLAAQSQSQMMQQLQDKTVKILDFLQYISQNLRLPGNDDIQMRFTQMFLSFDGSINNNTYVTVTLMQRGLLSPQKWDSQMASFVKESQQFTHSMSKEMNDLFNFLREFLEAIAAQKELNTLAFPNLMMIIQKLAENDQSIAKFFSGVIQDHRSRTVWTSEILRDYFNQWATIHLEEGNNQERQEQEVNRFFTNLKDQGLYKDPKAMQKFFKSMVELSVERALYLSDGETKRPDDRIVYRYIESFLNFCLVSLMKYTQPGDAISKHDFMSALFDTIHLVIDDDHRNKKGDFNQKPYYRILINILTLINNAQFFNQKTHFQVIFTLGDLFIKLNPKEYPAFAFAWLELISHKNFMPEFLSSMSAPGVAQPGSAQMVQGISQAKKPGQPASTQPQMAALASPQLEGSNFQKQFKFKELMVHLFNFLKSNMVVGQPMTESLAKFYEATLRVILVIKNDYPEFLCDFHFNLVNSLPEHCIQLRNIILSAQPRNIPYIDPFSKNLKVDTLPEIQLPPRSQSNYENYLQLQNLREDLEKYFRSKEKDKNLIKTIAEKMMQSEEFVNGRKRINSSIFNAVALFIQSYAHANKQKQQAQQKECYEILKSIILILTPDTRMCLLNSIVNELRYINCHTYFYSWMVIYLFNDIDETIQEQITRILIERLQTHDPHPWGLCITFRELLQNPKYGFAKKPFVLRNQAVIEQLMQTKLSNFYSFWANNKQVVYQQQQQSNSQQMYNGSQDQ